MIVQESGCVNCGLPCLGSTCPNYMVDVLVCDDCGKEVNKLYKFDDAQLCEECLLEQFETIS